MITNIIILFFLLQLTQSNEIKTSTNVTEGTCGTTCQFKFLNESKTLQITGKNRMTVFASPEVVPWHSYREEIENVTISNEITSIGPYSFSNCTKLSSITLPSEIDLIENYAFYNCTSIGKLSFPQKLKTISKYSFAFSSIQIENQFDKLSSIFEYAFYQCSKLTEIVIGNSELRISNYAFGNCVNVQKITTDVTCFYISPDAFDGCTGVKSLHFTMSNSGAFSNFNPDRIPWRNMGNHVTSITFVDTVTSISQYLFSNFTKIQSITFPSYLFSLSDYSFYNCTSLKEIILPTKMNFIGKYCFSHCSSVETIVIGNKMKEVRSMAFSYLTSLKTIRFVDSNEMKPVVCPTDAFQGTPLKNVTIQNYPPKIGFCKLSQFTDTTQNNSTSNKPTKNPDDEGSIVPAIVCCVVAFLFMIFVVFLIGLYIWCLKKKAPGMIQNNSNYNNSNVQMENENYVEEEVDMSKVN